MYKQCNIKQKKKQNSGHNCGKMLKLQKSPKMLIQGPKNVISMLDSGPQN